MSRLENDRIKLKVRSMWIVKQKFDKIILNIKN